MPSGDREFKDAVYAELARVGRAVAHPRRLELLDLLCQGPATVEALAHKASLSVASTSQHLKHLRDARLVQTTRRGTYVVYRLAGDAACELFTTVRRVAEQYSADLQAVTAAFLAGHRDVEELDVRTLIARIEREALVLVDVRPEDEYRAGHWPGAISLPLEELAARLANMPRAKTVVAYCRGPYCVLALNAVRILRAHGVSAVRLREGPSEWRHEGLALAEGDGA